MNVRIPADVLNHSVILTFSVHQKRDGCFCSWAVLLDADHPAALPESDVQHEGCVSPAAHRRGQEVEQRPGGLDNQLHAVSLHHHCGA